MREKSEFELVADSRIGDREAIAELFARHYPASLRLARRILRSPEESQDAVQSAYFSAFRHIDSFRGEASFKTWITRLVINQCRMVLRTPSRRLNSISMDDESAPVWPIQVASQMPTPERCLLSREIGSALLDAIDNLPKPQREMFSLCTIAGLTVKEAAAIVGVTRSAAKTRLFRAQVRVRSTLRPILPGRWSIAA